MRCGPRCSPRASELAYLAREETGLGRAEDKVVKNRMVTTKTPGPEDLEPHACHRGLRG